MIGQADDLGFFPSSPHFCWDKPHSASINPLIPPLYIVQSDSSMPEDCLELRFDSNILNKLIMIITLILIVVSSKYVLIVDLTNSDVILNFKHKILSSRVYGPKQRMPL
jgi:hypothetical protein